MNDKNKILTLLFLTLFMPLAFTQIVSLNPTFVTVDDEVTITYDATQGTGQLEGVAEIFMHTGVVTVSGGVGNWQYVQGTWGVYDENGKMENAGNNLHTKTINIRDFYGVPMGEEVTHLAFVFRNEDGSLEGKTEDGQDIFVSIFGNTSELLMNVISPTEEVLITEIGTMIPIAVEVSQESTIEIKENGSVLAMSSGAVTLFNYELEVVSGGQHAIEISADNGTDIISKTFTYIVNPTVIAEESPAGTKNGINKIDANTVRLQLWAPDKSFVYVIGDFNNWLPDSTYFMKRSSDNATWWLDIEGLNPSEEYAFQYFVDGAIRIGDPYSEKVLDPWNDDEITESTYPNLKDYPSGKTTGIVTVFQIQEIPFNWQNDNFIRPEKDDLVIYELLMRDFLETHNYQTLLDTLSYLERLGVNAIELMPINEFEGNDSWGYNPSYHMALDKYYGTKNAFKMLVDECHARGIAVILDVVYNHAFSQSPLAKLYWNPTTFKPTPENPWLNVDAKHPFNVGYDFNHESQATQDWLDQVTTYWLEEYHIDGMRIDLSKGFTQTFTTDVGLWGNYDPMRVFLLKRMANVLWDINPDFYVILEHFADPNEEKDLADYGMMLWGNGVHEYNEASMGWNSNLSVVDYNVSWRNFNDPHLIGYLESHDEERLVFKNQMWGNANGDYDIQSLETSLQREELAGAFFFTLPGPKMFWQFGELGYGYSINRCEDGSISPDCRLSPKPIRWDYQNINARREIYNTWQALIYLKTNFEVFKTTDYQYNLSSFLKRINLNGTDMNVTVIGNFDVEAGSIDPQFQQTGWWYEYFTGDSLNVTDVNTMIDLEAGEYRLYLTEPIDRPIVSVQEPTGLKRFGLFPNPSDGELIIELELEEVQDCTLSLFDFSGKMIKKLYEGRTNQFFIQPDLQEKIAGGIYFIQLKTESGVVVKKWVVR